MFHKRFISIVLTIVLLAGLLPVQPFLTTSIEAASLSSGAHFPVGKEVEIVIPDGTKAKSETYDVEVRTDLNGVIGKGVLVNRTDIRVNNGYPLVHEDKAAQWVRELNGVWSTARTKLEGKQYKVTSDDNVTNIYYNIADLATFSGAGADGWNQDWKDPDKWVRYKLTNAPKILNVSVNGTSPSSTTISEGSSATISYSYQTEGYFYRTEIDNIYLNGKKIKSYEAYNPRDNDAPPEITINRDYTIPYSQLQVGNNTLRIDVADYYGRTDSSSTYTFTVNGSTANPVAVIHGPASGQSGDTITLTNDSYDSDGYIVNSVWDVPSGVTVKSKSEDSIKFTLNSTSPVTFGLTVTDNDGNKGSATHTISSYAPRQGPTAVLDGPTDAIEGDTIIVYNKSFDSDGEIVDVVWSYPKSKVTVKKETDSLLQFEVKRSGSISINITVTDDDGLTDSTTHKIGSLAANAPPVARIKGDMEPIQGEIVTYKNTSTDEDGEIASATWTVTAIAPLSNRDFEIKEETKDYIKIQFMKEGEFKIILSVTDGGLHGGDELSDNTSKTIRTKPAIPQAQLHFGKHYKVNRLFIADGSNSFTSPIFPITHYEFEFIPLIEGNNDSSIQISSQESTDAIKKLLFKEPGDYQVRLRVKNSAGHWSEWAEKFVTISPDEAPIVDFYLVKKATRDSTNNNRAKIEIVDESYSPDQDRIAKRIWKYRYDKNNDGSFEDETWIIFSNKNETEPEIYVTDVGKYQIGLSIEEEFGQPTIPHLITKNDKRSANTLNFITDHTTVEVINIRPTTYFASLPRAKADLVFTIGETDPAITENLKDNIISYLEPRLHDAGIDFGTINSIETTSFSSNDADAEEIFNHWQRYGYNKDTWQFYADSGIIRRQNNDWWSGFYDPQFNSDDYTLSLQMGSFGGDDDDIGISFGMEDVNKPFYTFLLSGNKRSWSNSTRSIRTHGHASGLYEYHGGKIGSGYLKGEVNLSNRTFINYQWHDVTLKVKSKNVKIYLDGSLVIDYNAPRALSGSFGFFTNSQPMGSFRNLQITAQQSKSLDDVLNEPIWRNDAQHFVIDIRDIPYPELENEQKSSMIQSRLIQDEIHLAVMGTAQNKKQAQEIIKKNNNNGTFIHNGNMQNALNQLADYVINTIKQTTDDPVQYVLLQDEVQYETVYQDHEQDPKLEERWFYEHDPNYFDNSLGRADFDQKFLKNPVNQFSKVGKFRVTYQAKDNPKSDNHFSSYRLWSQNPQQQMDLYVHRRPQSLFTYSIGSSKTNSYPITFQDHSYDPDHLTEINRGIIKREWKWKKSDDTEWYQGVPQILSHNEVILVSLRVLDPEGQWSFPDVKVISTTVTNTPPVAHFTVSPNPVVENGTIQYNTQGSYDPDVGDRIIQEAWRIQQTQGSWTDYGNQPPHSIQKAGKYRVEYMVQDTKGAWSEPFYQTVEVIEQNHPPQARFTINPNPVPVDVTVNYIDQSGDPDGDPIVEKQWRFRKAGNNQYGPWHFYQPPQKFDSLGTGFFQIQLRVKDQPKNKSLEPLWSDWYQQTLTVIGGNRRPQARLEISPNPIDADEPLLWIDRSVDPEGMSLQEYQLTITQSESGESKTFRGDYLKSSGASLNLSNRFISIFEKSGFANDGVGVYRLSYRVRDISPNKYSPAQWSEWQIQQLVVESPLRMDGEVNPTLVRSGQAIMISAETEGKAEKVTVNVDWNRDGDTRDNNENLSLQPIHHPPALQDENQWQRSVIIPLPTWDGTYTIKITATKTSPVDGSVKSATVNKTITVKGDIFDDHKIEIFD